VAFGQVLRVVSGQGTDLVFIGVSALFLGLFLIGWRLVAARSGRAWASRPNQ
jgi:hypothetical protein